MRPTSTFSDCRRCHGTGVFLARKDEETGPYAFRCSCDRGKSTTRMGIPFFTDWHQKEGWVYFDVKQGLP